MTAPFRAACVQTNSGPEVAPNVEAARGLVRRARDAGGELILLPETLNMMDSDKRRLRAKASPEKGDSALAAFRELARETGAWLVVGSLVVRGCGGRLANRSFLIGGDGAVVARYDKIHMFDVRLGDGESFTESAAYRPGQRAVVADTPWGRLGMTVCYDLRFPGLYRDLADAGAGYLSVPSAFTRTTGRAHWHVLLRARAIETGCYVLAPAQCGRHHGGRLTYGHSLIVDPWGEVLADGGDGVGFVTADIDPARIAEARRKKNGDSI